MKHVTGYYHRIKKILLLVHVGIDLPALEICPIQLRVKAIFSSKMFGFNITLEL